MLDVQSVDELCKSVIETSVNWNNFYELKSTAEKDLSAKTAYVSILSRLIFLDVLSYEPRGHYRVQIPNCDGGGFVNPYLEGKILFFVDSSDAETVKEKFVNSFIIRTQS